MEYRQLWAHTREWGTSSYSASDKFWRVHEKLNEMLEKLEVSAFQGTRFVPVHPRLASGESKRFGQCEGCCCGDEIDHPAELEFGVTCVGTCWHFQARESFAHRVRLASVDPECRRIVMELIVTSDPVRAHMTLVFFDKPTRTTYLLDPHGYDSILQDIVDGAAPALRALLGLDARVVRVSQHDRIQRCLPGTQGLCSLYAKLMMMRVGNHFKCGGRLTEIDGAMNDPVGADSLRQLDVVLGAAYSPDVMQNVQCVGIVRAFESDYVRRWGEYPSLLFCPEDDLAPFRDLVTESCIFHYTEPEFRNTVDRVGDLYDVDPELVRTAMWLITMYTMDFDKREPEHVSVVMQTYRVPRRVAVTLMAALDACRVPFVLQIARALGASRLHP